jgi:hypothetical protein
VRMSKEGSQGTNLCCSFFNSRLDIHIARLVGQGL